MKRRTEKYERTKRKKQEENTRGKSERTTMEIRNEEEENIKENSGR